MTCARTTRVADIPLIQIEEAGLNALQTPRQLFYDGWLLRLLPGKAKRARSVNAHFGSSLPLAVKIAHCEALYARCGLPPLFRVTPFVQPPELDAALAERGYVAFDASLVQTRVLTEPPEVPAAGPEVDVRIVDAVRFVAAIAELRGLGSAEMQGFAERLVHSPLVSRYALVEEEGRVVCAAQIATEHAIAGVFDVVTAAEDRGRGYATLAVARLLSWAWEHAVRVAYLQVAADNGPALALYRKFGFKTRYEYHYRAPPES